MTRRRQDIMFEEGVEAYDDGMAIEDNPYNMDTQEMEYTAWRMGFETAENNDKEEDVA